MPGYRQAEALLAVGAPRQQTEAILHPAHQTAVTLGAAPLRREVELLAQRGRLRSGEPVDTTASPEVLPSSAASLGLTRREVEVLALVAEGRTNPRIWLLAPHLAASTSAREVMRSTTAMRQSHASGK